MIINGRLIPPESIEKVKATRGVISPANVAAECGLTPRQVRDVRRRLDEESEGPKFKGGLVHPNGAVKKTEALKLEYQEQWKDRNIPLINKILIVIAMSGRTMLVGDIAKITKIDRGTVFTNVKQLLKKKFIFISRRSFYSASMKGILKAEKLGAKADKVAMKRAINWEVDHEC